MRDLFFELLKDAIDEINAESTTLDTADREAKEKDISCTVLDLCMLSTRFYRAGYPGPKSFFISTEICSSGKETIRYLLSMAETGFSPKSVLELGLTRLYSNKKGLTTR